MKIAQIIKTQYEKCLSSYKTTLDTLPFILLMGIICGGRGELVPPLFLPLGSDYVFLPPSHFLTLISFFLVGPNLDVA